MKPRVYRRADSPVKAGHSHITEQVFDDLYGQLMGIKNPPAITPWFRRRPWTRIPSPRPPDPLVAELKWYGEMIEANRHCSTAWFTVIEE